MSTILKALKQSEARRPREASLPAGLPEAGRKRPARSTLPWLVGAGVALTAAVGTWALWPGGEASGPEPRARRIAEVSMPERRTASPRAADESPAEQLPAREPGQSAFSANGSTPRPTDDRAAGKVEQAPIRAKAGDGSAAETNGPTAGTADDSPGDTGPEIGAEVPEQALDPHALLPRLEYLPAARREALPKLNLNAHVFAPQPEQSFVLINLSRYRAGDRVAPGLTVAEIFPGGVVMEDDEGRFVLPRP